MLSISRKHKLARQGQVPTEPRANEQLTNGIASVLRPVRGNSSLPALEPAALSRSGQAVPVSFPSWKPAQPFCVRNAYACARKTEGPEWRSLDAQ